MISLMTSPSAQAALAATACRLPGSWARCVIDQKAGVNAAPQSVMVKREAIMAGLNLVFSITTQAALSLPFAKAFKALPAWGRYETLIRAGLTIPGMILTEYLSRKGAYSDLKASAKNPTNKLTAEQKPSSAAVQSFALNPLVAAATLVPPLLASAMHPAAFGAYTTAFPTTPSAPAALNLVSPLYY
jgi:hypothetical protein